MWTCSKCGEKVQDDFEVCWSCGTTMDGVEDASFDLIVTLTPEAHHKALELTRRVAAEVEYWPTADPTLQEGNREQRLNAYRAVRDQLLRRVRDRFGGPPLGNE